MVATERSKHTFRMTNNQDKELALLTNYLFQENVINNRNDNESINYIIKFANDTFVRPSLESKESFENILKKYNDYSQNLKNESMIDSLKKIDEAVQVLTLLNLNQFVAQDVPAEVKIAAMQTTTTKNSKVAQAATRLREIYQNMKIKRINESKSDRL